jgi:hypothetical protein
VPAEPIRNPIRAAVILLALVVPGVSPAGIGIWISSEELRELPTSGPAWENLLAQAREPLDAPDLADQDSQVDVRVLAKALVYARTGDAALRNDVLVAIGRVAHGHTEKGGRTLALCRGLISYVLAADLVGLPPELDADFRRFLSEVRNEPLDGKTLISTHEMRPNNWGTHCGASRAALDRYLGDESDLKKTAKVLKGWLGDRSSYAGFTFGKDLSWQANSSSPVGVNPRGATLHGHSVDGVIPDDQRRAGGFSWPPTKTGYAWGALQGVVATAIILDRAGMPDVWQWQDRAILRAARWLQDTRFTDGASYAAEGDDTWIPYVLNHYYGTSFPVSSSARPGKGVGWTDWTYAARPEPPRPAESPKPPPASKRSP